MKSARTLAALCLACLLPLGAQAQTADPAVWGVYARLLGARMAWEKTASLTYTWYWNGPKTAIVEDQGQSNLDTGEIKSLGGGRLARYVKDELLWTGTIQPDGAVIWKPEGGFFTGRSGGPFRVRLEGDSMLVQEGVTLENGRVTRSSVWQRWVGSLPAFVPVVATASAPEAAASAPLTVVDAQPVEEKTGPRALSEQDLAKLRNSMARDKVQRAETLKRQQEEAVRQEQVRRQQAEYEVRMAAERAQQAREEREEERRSDDAFASALMGGLNTFKNEMAKGQAERAQQQAFLANLQRQQQQAADARQREQDRQRQAAAQEQLQRQQQAAAAQQQQQRQAATPAGGTPANGARPATTVPAPSPQPSQAEIAERQLRERAAAERQRLQQAAVQPRTTPVAVVTPTPAAPAGPAPATNPPKAYSAVLVHSMAKGSKSNTHPTCYSNVLRLSIPYGQSPGSVIEPLYARFVAQCTQQIDGVLRGPLTAAPSWYSDTTGDDFKSLLQGYRNWQENAQVQVTAP